MIKDRTSRLAPLDGLRGIAILMVISLHYFGEPTLNRIYPFGSTFSEGASPFKYGGFGVELFFLISGFVIALTLERCKSAKEFAVRRVIRLWPALIFFSFAVYVLLSFTSTDFSPRPPSWETLLPSLTLTPLNVWRPWFPNIDLINGVYWTLIIEVQFYAVAALIFFGFSSRSLARNLVVFTIVNILIRAFIRKFAPVLTPFYNFFEITDFMPWFAAGAIFYELYTSRLSRIASLLMLGPMFLIVVRTNTFADANHSAVVLTAISLLFFLSFWLVATRSQYASAFGPSLLVKVGRGSYSIYLAHYVFGMTIISLIPKSSSFGLQIIFTICIGLGAIVLGYASFLTIENPAANLLHRKFIGNRARNAPAAAANGDEGMRLTKPGLQS